MISRLKMWLFYRRARKESRERYRPCREARCDHVCKHCHDFGLGYFEMPMIGKAIGSCSRCLNGARMSSMEKERVRGAMDFPPGCWKCANGIIVFRTRMPLWSEICTCPAGMWLRGFVIGSGENALLGE